MVKFDYFLLHFNKDRLEEDIGLYCKHCGQQVPEKSKFCWRCGQTVPTQPAPSQNDPSTPQATPVQTEPVKAEPVKTEPLQTTNPIYNSDPPARARCTDCGIILEDGEQGCCANCLAKRNATAHSPAPAVSASREIVESSLDDETDRGGSKKAAIIMISIFALIVIACFACNGNKDSNTYDDVAIADSVAYSMPKEYQKVFTEDVRWTIEHAVKKKIANPDTATFKHDYAAFTGKNAKFTGSGIVAYQEESGRQTEKTFSVTVMAAEKCYYTLSIQLGDTVLFDYSNSVNSLGIITAEGEAIYDKPEGTSLFEIDDGNLITIADSKSEQVTLDEYRRIEMGTKYSEVTELIGSLGEEISKTSVLGVETAIIKWKGNGDSDSNATITFSDGKVIAKVQLGLK